MTIEELRTIIDPEEAEKIQQRFEYKRNQARNRYITTGLPEVYRKAIEVSTTKALKQIDEEERKLLETKAELAQRHRKILDVTPVGTRIADTPLTEEHRILNPTTGEEHIEVETLPTEERTTILNPKTGEKTVRVKAIHTPIVAEAVGEKRLLEVDPTDTKHIKVFRDTDTRAAIPSITKKRAPGGKVFKLPVIEDTLIEAPEISTYNPRDYADGDRLTDNDIQLYDIGYKALKDYREKQQKQNKFAANNLSLMQEAKASHVDKYDKKREDHAKNVEEAKKIVKSFDGMFTSTQANKYIKGKENLKRGATPAQVAKLDKEIANIESKRMTPMQADEFGRAKRLLDNPTLVGTVKNIVAKAQENPYAENMAQAKTVIDETEGAHYETYNEETLLETLKEAVDEDMYSLLKANPQVRRHLIRAFNPRLTMKRIELPSEAFDKSFGIEHVQGASTILAGMNEEAMNVAKEVQHKKDEQAVEDALDNAAKTILASTSTPAEVDEACDVFEEAYGSHSLKEYEVMARERMTIETEVEAATFDDTNKPATKKVKVLRRKF